MQIKNEELLKRYNPDAWARLKAIVIKDKWKYLNDIMYKEFRWSYKISMKFDWWVIESSWSNCQQMIEDFIKQIDFIINMSLRNAEKVTTSIQQENE